MIDENTIKINSTLQVQDEVPLVSQQSELVEPLEEEYQIGDFITFGKYEDKN